MESNVTTIVQGYQKKRKHFQVADVTKELRKRTPEVYYTEVKGELSDLYESHGMPGYLRTLMPVEGCKMSQWVYHPDNEKPNPSPTGVREVVNAVLGFPAYAIDFFKGGPNV